MTMSDTVGLCAQPSRLRGSVDDVSSGPYTNGTLAPAKDVMGFLEIPRKGLEILNKTIGDHESPGLLALPRDRDPAGAHINGAETNGLSNSNPSDVEKLDKSPVPACWRGIDKSLDVFNGQDTLVKVIRDFSAPQHTANVNGRVAGAPSKAQQTLDSSNPPGSCCRCSPQSLAPLENVGHRQLTDLGSLPSVNDFSVDTYR